MNLLQDPWLTATDTTSHSIPISPLDIGQTNLQDLSSPRTDFRGALYQFLIGLLQTTYAPVNADEWKERWHSPPDRNALQKIFAPYAVAFELSQSGPTFMQDLVVQPTY